jgi:hypothetical protein
LRGYHRGACADTSIGEPNDRLVSTQVGETRGVGRPPYMVRVYNYMTAGHKKGPPARIEKAVVCSPCAPRCGRLKYEPLTPGEAYRAARGGLGAGRGTA